MQPPRCRRTRGPQAAEGGVAADALDALAYAVLHSVPDAERAMMDVFVALRGVTDLNGLRSELRRAESLGATGILVNDHVASSFRTVAPVDAYTFLGAAGTLSDQLILGTLVANVGVLHPVLAARKFLQLALLFGGERVVAGIGAGWHVDDFRSVGLERPEHADRVERLEEAAKIMRSLFDTGTVTFAGKHVNAQDVAIAPMPQRSPQLLIGGGSRRLLSLAARLADQVDLNAPIIPRAAAKSDPQRAKSDPQRADRAKRLSTTVAELEDAAAYVRRMAAAEGRDAAHLRLSIFLSHVVVCASEAVEAIESEICDAAGLSWRPLSDCPYVLLGQPDVIRDRLRDRVERLSLSALVTSNGPHLESFLGVVRELVPAPTAPS
jgi:alkanesulfonate monooxygenase SsuD/methylene tetrahydromethanopterin reductase-like flavin-dependent oxidoreductase (luciferase family)